MDAVREPSSEQARRVALSLVLMFFGMLLSHKIVGRLAFSNIAQLASLVTLFSAFPHVLRPRDVGWILLSCGAVIAAALSVYSAYGYEAQPQHAVFFLAAGIYLVAWYRATRTYRLVDITESAVRWTILPILAYVSIHTAVDLAAGDVYTDMGFDDKSHAAVAIGVYAFVALRLWRNAVKLPIAGAFMLLSLLTASRLPLLMVPFFVLAFIVEYRHTRRLADSVWKVYVCHVTVIVGAIGTLVTLVNNWDSFHVFSRVGENANSSSQSSTEAHLLLIQFGIQIKFDNVLNVLLGVTPGGFAGTVYRSGIDISEIPSGGGGASIAAGTAPMHSTHTSIFAEFPLPIFVLYAVLLVWLLVRLVRRRDNVLALGLMGFVAATMFYSSHNEVYFYAILALFIAEASGPAPEADVGPVRGTRIPRRALRGISTPRALAV
ncbi:hypothetical protein [Georgenia deserti]|uniref:O-antigen ligase domain-containing protein n=1 Tax=Georgenia deserti TaxID=2093781 RepID=A0ABW4L187_9MICO